MVNDLLTVCSYWPLSVLQRQHGTDIVGMLEINYEMILNKCDLHKNLLVKI